MAGRFDLRFVRRRGDPAGLGPLDLGGEVAHRDVAIATGQGPGQVDDDGDFRGHDRRQLLPADPRPEVTELAEGGRMEGRRRDPGPTERGEPLAHLAGGLVGERDDERVRRRDRPRLDRIGHPARDRPGLAGPGAGQDADRAGRREDRLALGRIEVREEVRGEVEHPVIVDAQAHRRLMDGAPSAIRRPRLCSRPRARRAPPVCAFSLPTVRSRTTHAPTGPRDLREGPLRSISSCHSHRSG